MRVLICPDKFKGSLSSGGVAEAIARGIRSVRPDWQLELLPVADGGEGTTDVLCQAFHGERRAAVVSDALGRPVEAFYGWIGGERPWAVLEMSQASGLWRIEAGERDPLRANTRGVGELMLAAIRDGATSLCIGLGGSATNDGGSGMARALGWQFLDDAGRDLGILPGELSRLIRIVRGCAVPEITLLSDVENPLLGDRGATAVFGPQKGVTPNRRPILENALTRLADVTEAALWKSFRHIPGAGAAGGLGFGLLAFCGARIEMGFPWLARQLDLEARALQADVLITGEGRLDAQTAHGKAPAGIAALAHKVGRPVVAFAGRIEVAHGFDHAYSLEEIEPDPQASMARAAELLETRAAQWAGSFRKAPRV